MKIKEIDMPCPYCKGKITFKFIQGLTTAENVVYRCDSCGRTWKGYCSMAKEFLNQGIAEGKKFAEEYRE